MKKLKTILIISLSLNLITSFFVVKRIYLEHEAEKEVAANKVQQQNAKITYFLNRDELFESLPIDSNSIVFLGNSLTQSFELAELFQNLKVKNRGIMGDAVKGVINRIGPIVRSNPKKIFIEIGINDLGAGVPKDTVLVRYKFLVDTLKAALPQTKIYIQSLFPTEIHNQNFETYCTKEVNRDIVAINKALSEFAISRKVIFIDTYSSFVLDGHLNSKYSVDGVHLNGAAYKLWTQILKPYVNE